MGRSVAASSPTVFKAILDRHLTKEGHSRDRERKEIEDYEQLCLKRIRREVSRAKEEMLGNEDWAPALSRHVAEYILRRAVAGDPCDDIAAKLKKRKIAMEQADVQRFLDYVVKMGPVDYRRELLAELLKNDGDRPKGRQGRKPGLRNDLLGYLAWTEEGDRQRRAQSWRSWTLDEIRFYLQSGIIPPNRYRVTEDLQDRSCFDFGEWRGRVDSGWCRRVSNEVAQCGSSEEVKELYNDLGCDKCHYVNKVLRKAKHRIPSRDYVGRMLDHYGYHRVKLGIGYEWRLKTEIDSEPSALAAPGQACLDDVR